LLKIKEVSHIEVSNGLARPSTARPQEARLYKWIGPAHPNYNWAADSRARPACVGHEPLVFYF